MAVRSVGRSSSTLGSILAISISIVLLALAPGSAVATVTIDPELQTVSEGASFWSHYMVLDSDDRPHMIFHDTDTIYYAIAQNGTWSSQRVDTYWSDLSVAIDRNDVLHLCFQRYNNTEDVVELMYANNAGGSWRTLAVAGGWDILGGQIAVDANGRAHICYHNADGDLFYITNADGSWTTRTIVDDAVTSSSMIFFRSQDALGIIYREDDTGNLMAAALNGEEWDTQIIDSNVIGYSLSLTPASRASVHLSYDTHDGELKYATDTNGSWSSQIIAPALWTYEHHIAVDSNDLAHILYVDDTDGDLKYVTNANGSWSTTLIDQGGDIDRCHIAIDRSDKVHIGFNYPYGDLMYVTNADGTWTEHTVVHTEDGTYSSGPMLMDLSGKVHIAFQLVPSNEIYYAIFTPKVVTVPGPPTDLSALGQNGHVNLSWSAPLEDGGRNISSYLVYRGADPGSLTVIASIEGRSYVDAGVIKGQRYWYQVYAVNSEGVGTGSVVVNMTFGDRPSPPINLTATYENGSVYIHWNAPTDDGGSPVTSYKIYRGTNSAAMEYLSTVNGTTYQDGGLQAGSSYHYAITAVNGMGEGVSTQTVNVTVPGPSSPSSMDGVLLLSGLAIMGGVAAVAALWWKKGRSRP